MIFLDKTEIVRMPFSTFEQSDLGGHRIWYGYACSVSCRRTYLSWMGIVHAEFCLYSRFLQGQKGAN